jgi:hypothetical protein
MIMAGRQLINIRHLPYPEQERVCDTRDYGKQRQVYISKNM